MSPRFITEIEKEYSRKFKESRLIWMMFSYDDWYDKLLKKAISSGVPLTRDDFLPYYNEETIVAIEEWQRMCCEFLQEMLDLLMV